MKKEQNEIYANNVKKYDVLLVIIIFVIAMLTAVAIHFIKDNNGDSQKLVVVTLNNKEYGKYPLSKDRVLDISDDNHRNIIVIADNQVFMKEADCPDGYCIKTGTIKEFHESIICLPNRLVVEICADADEDGLEGYDAADADEDELEGNVDADANKDEVERNDAADANKDEVERNDAADADEDELDVNVDAISR